MKIRSCKYAANPHAEAPLNALLDAAWEAYGTGPNPRFRPEASDLSDLFE